MSGTYQLLPALSEQQYADLQADIKANGVRVPIDVDEHNEILDGHHRAAIAAALGYDCPRRTVSGLDEADKRSHALAVNMQRRMLSRDQIRDLVVASVKADTVLSDREHARRCGVSPSTVAHWRQALEIAGEVSKLDTRQNPQGRPQPATKQARPRSPGVETPAQGEDHSAPGQTDSDATSPAPDAEKHHDPIGDAKNEAKAAPARLGSAAIVCLEKAHSHIENAGGPAKICADNDDLGAAFNPPLWADTLDRLIPLLTEWRRQLRRTHLRGVK